MSLPTLLTTLENLVVEIALWIVLVPKTLIHLVLHPRAIPSLADATIDNRDTHEQDEYVSPVLLWLIVGVLPGIPMITSEQGPQWIAHALLGRLGIEGSIAAASTLLLLGPLSFAAAQSVVMRRPLGRSDLRRSFAIQCGCFAVVYLAYFAALAANLQAVLTSYEWIYRPVAYGLMVCGIAWFVFAEFVVLRSEPGGRPARALAVMVLGVLAWLGLVMVSRLLLLLMSVYYL